MIVAEGYLRFHHFPDEPPRRQLADSVLPIVERAATEYLGAFEHPRRGEVVVEEGSTTVRGIIGMSAAALIAYGGLRQAIDYSLRDGRAAASWIIDQVEEVLHIPRGAMIARRRLTPAPTRLRRLFDSVAAGTLTPAEATERARRILEDYSEAPDTIARVTAAIREALPPSVVRAPTLRPTPDRSGAPLLREAAHGGRRLRVFRDPATGRVRYVEE